MNFISRMKGLFKNESEGISMSAINDLFFNGTSAELGADITEITYFTCLKTLSEAVGKMPVYLMDSQKNRIMNHETMKVLSSSPNSVMTPVQFFTTMEYCRNHFGNAYAYAHRVAGRLKSVHILDPRMVQIWINNTEVFTDRGYYYRYSDEKTGKEYWINPEDMLHVKSWVTDRTGISGKSVREILATNMSGSKAAQKFLNDMYQKGLTANAVIKHVGDLSREAQSKMLKMIEKQARDDGRRMITLPVGYDIQTLNLSLADSQFYELKKYNALQIAAAFGVKPDHLNDYDKSSYASSSMQNLSFYVNTLLYNITMYEQEFNRKLLTEKEQTAGVSFKFNVWTILRGDPSQQADILQKMVSSAIYSPNEAREKLDMSPCEGGDVHMVNGSYVKLQDVGLAYASKIGGGDNSAENSK